MRPAWSNPALLGFECRACGAQVAPESLAPVCPLCGKPLVARYDRDALADRATRRLLPREAPGLWRWGAMLPFAEEFPAIRLGEGGTPLLPLRAVARELGLAEVSLKDEAGNPTQSFKARGLCLAVSGAVALGKRGIALPSAGNAGSAAAAYAAAAGLACRVIVPERTPEAFTVELAAFGAEVRRVPGTIADAGKALAGWAPAPDWWNVATFKEPFRLEGKKTLGYEIAEQCGWRLPEFILYPTGGGTGLVGMWRAFVELRELGMLHDPPPRLVAVQAEGCAPVVRAWSGSTPRIAPFENPHTVASGLNVPAPFADELILTSIRETSGLAIAVSEDEMLEGMIRLARMEGCFACPEGGATLAGLERLRADGTIREHHRVVIFNTGSGLKYLEAWRQGMRDRSAVSEREA
jgi:threonine synthase